MRIICLFVFIFGLFSSVLNTTFSIELVDKIVSANELEGMWEEVGVAGDEVPSGFALKILGNA